MTSTKRLIKRLAVFEAFGLAFLLILGMIILHAQGGRVVVDMTTYGERYIELLALYLLTPILVLGLHYYLEDSRPAAHE